MDSSTNTVLQILRQRVDSLVEEGDYDEAVHAASAVVDKAQETLSTDLDSIDEFASALELRGDLYRSLSRYDEARDDYKQALDQLENRTDRQIQIGRLNASFGACHDALGNSERATELWEEAMRVFEECDPPQMLDVGAMANNLAYLRKSDGDVEGAETYFLKSLEIYHRYLGPEDEATATICNNLGALYLASGHEEQAREMHMMALEARRSSLGDAHPDTAQSHNNLALALLATGDRSWARRHFEKSALIFESLGPDYDNDLEAVMSNYTNFLREEGEDALADRLQAQLIEMAGA